MSFVSQRHAMCEEQLRARGIADRRVLAAMEEIPREAFVSQRFRNQAYDDCPLPIACGQTISQPFTVAYMTEKLELVGNEKVLEIGTGSGYQTAILARLAGEVYSVERHRELSETAALALAGLGIENVHLLVGDGTSGWADHAPYDAILVAAASPVVPAPLRHQLGDGGRLVIPVGSPADQRLLRLRRHGGEIVEEDLGPFRFVPLIGEFGWTKDQS